MPPFGERERAPVCVRACMHICSIYMHSNMHAPISKCIFITMSVFTDSVHKGPLTVLASHEDFSGVC